MGGVAALRLAVLLIVTLRSGFVPSLGGRTRLSCWNAERISFQRCCIALVSTAFFMPVLKNMAKDYYCLRSPIDNQPRYENLSIRLTIHAGRKFPSLGSAIKIHDRLDERGRGLNSGSLTRLQRL